MFAIKALNRMITYSVEYIITEASDMIVVEIANSHYDCLNWKIIEEAPYRIS
jgi:hypothetical protein